MLNVDAIIRSDRDTSKGYCYSEWNTLAANLDLAARGQRRAFFGAILAILVLVGLFVWAATSIDGVALKAAAQSVAAAGASVSLLRALSLRRECRALNVLRAATSETVDDDQLARILL